MPWWIAEGTAEYISIMKYQNGYFACNVVSKRQVTPELEKCAQIVNARGGAANPFESAMTYRGETNAEAVMDEYLADIERRLKAIEEHFKLQITHLKEQLAPMEEKRDMFAKMLALEAGQSCVVNPTTTKKTREVAAIQGVKTIEHRMDNTVRPLGPRTDGLEMDQRYRASTLLVYHLTTLSPDKGEAFARYMWGLQRLRDEYDFSIKLLEKDRENFAKDVDRLNPLLEEMGVKAEAYAQKLNTFLRNAAFYAEEQGRFAQLTTTGQTEFTHLPGGSIKMPVPPPVLDLKLPSLPSAPVARLTSGQLRTRRDQLFSQLTNGYGFEGLVQGARVSFAKRGIKF